MSDVQMELDSREVEYHRMNLRAVMANPNLNITAVMDTLSHYDKIYSGLCRMYVGEMIDINLLQLSNIKKAMDESGFIKQYMEHLKQEGVLS